MEETEVVQTDEAVFASHVWDTLEAAQVSFAWSAPVGDGVFVTCLWGVNTVLSELTVDDQERQILAWADSLHHDNEPPDLPDGVWLRISDKLN